jgi:hypothetical protein
MKEQVILIFGGMYGSDGFIIRYSVACVCVDVCACVYESVRRNYSYLNQNSIH